MAFFRKKTWPPNFRNPPWGSAPSIYDHISAHIDPEKETGLPEAGYRLPDEPDPDPNRISFIAGGLDGVFSHHGSPQAEDRLVAALHAALKSATENASERNIKALYSLIKDGSAIDVIDALTEKIQAARSLDPDRLRDIVYWFTTNAADREAVKFSMALLGLLRGSDDSEVFLTLGRHDEFTLYSAVAIANNEDYGERMLWRLARGATGWGRISAVERLVGSTDAEVKDWLIREGYKNEVMYEYLACICARAGELHLALQAENIDDDLFNSACQILDTLVAGDGGPTEGLADYEHGHDAVASLLKHGDGRFSTASHYWFLCRLKDWIDARRSGEDEIDRNWTSGAGELTARLDGVLANDRWRPVIMDALESGGAQDFWDASRACGKLGIDPWPYFHARTAEGEDHWWDLMRTSGAARIDKALDLARKHIPLEDIATGPRDDMGIGPEYSAHHALEFVLQELGQYPGKGWAFVSAGLKSPVTRNRNMALRALSGWGRENWPKDAVAALDALKKLEPDSDLRRRIDDVLAGREID